MEKEPIIHQELSPFLTIINEYLKEGKVALAMQVALEKNQSESWIYFIKSAQEHNLLTKDLLLEIVKKSNDDEVLVKALETGLILPVDLKKINKE
jgi:hypothetical protein